MAIRPIALAIPLALALVVHARAVRADDDTHREGPALPDFHFPRPEPPAIEDRRSDPPDVRVETHASPRLHAPWLSPALGTNVTLKPEFGMAFAAEGVASVPFQIWRGAFDPAFFPTLRTAWHGRSTLDLATGFGAGIFEGKHGFRDGWQTLSYTPQLLWRVLGSESAALGFRHDLVFKPGLWHVGIAHTMLSHENASLHELTIVLGTSLLEGL